MKAKHKQCGFCPTIGPLWKSNPATCPTCARKQDAIKRSQESASKPTYNHTTLKQSESGEVAKPFKVYNACNVKRVKNKAADQINSKADINKFFLEQSEQVPANCENCGKLLRAYSMWTKRFVTAHILPKSEESGFPSVATHPDNRMFLGCSLFSDCGCHGNFDNKDAEYRKTMPVYEKALERADKFFDMLSPADQVRAEKYLGIELSKAI